MTQCGRSSLTNCRAVYSSLLQMHSMSELHGQTETLNVLIYVLLTSAVLLLTFPLKRTWHWINEEHCKGDNVLGDGRK